MGATGGFYEMVSFAFVGAAGNLEPEEEGTLGIDLDGLGAGANSRLPLRMTAAADRKEAT